MTRHVSILLGALVLCAAFPAPAETYDVLIKNGMIYDGSGGAPFSGAFRNASLKSVRSVLFSTGAVPLKL